MGETEREKGFDCSKSISNHPVLSAFIPELSAGLKSIQGYIYMLWSGGSMSDSLSPSHIHSHFSDCHNVALLSSMLVNSHIKQPTTLTALMLIAHSSHLSSGERRGSFYSASLTWVDVFQFFYFSFSFLSEYHLAHTPLSLVMCPWWLHQPLILLSEGQLGGKSPGGREWKPVQRVRGGQFYLINAIWIDRALRFWSSGMFNGAQHSAAEGAPWHIELCWHSCPRTECERSATCPRLGSTFSWAERVCKDHKPCCF